MKSAMGYLLAFALASPVIFLSPSAMLADDAVSSDTLVRINPLAGSDLPSLKAFVERPLFSSTRKAPAPLEPEDVPDEIEPEATETLNIRLLGVVVTPSRTVAHVENLDDMTTRVLKVGDNFRAWTIKSIDPAGLVMEKDDETRHFTLFKASEP